MQTLRDIRFSKDKVNTLACTKTITNTKTMTKTILCLTQFGYIQTFVWTKKNWSLEASKLDYHRLDKILSSL